MAPNDVQLNHYTGVVNSNAFFEIKFVLISSQFGLCSRIIEVINESSKQNIMVSVRFFVDENVLITDLEQFAKTIDFKLIYLEYDKSAPKKGEEEPHDLKKDDTTVTPLAQSVVAQQPTSSITMASPTAESEVLKFPTIVPLKFHNFYLENRSSHKILLTPKTNLNLIVTWEHFDAAECSNSSYLFEITSENSLSNNSNNNNSISSSFHVCGKDFELKPYKRVVVFVGMTTSTIFRNPRFKKQLLEGRKVEMLGCLLFDRKVLSNDKQKTMIERTCKLIDIPTAFVINYAKITPEVIDIGVVGYENGFKDKKFELIVENLAESSLFGFWKIPNGLHLSAESSLSLKPWQTRAITVILVPTKLEFHNTSNFELCLELVNSHNSLNKLTCLIRGKFSSSPIHISSLNDKSELILPQLVFPSDSPLDSWFMIENTSQTIELDLSLKFDILAQLGSFISVDLLSRSGHSLTSHFFLQPLQAIEVLVRVHTRNSNLTSLPFESVGDREIVLGKLQVLSQIHRHHNTIFTAPVRAPFVVMKTFELSTEHIHFNYKIQPDQKLPIERKEYFTITSKLPTNLSFDIFIQRAQQEQSSALKGTSSQLSLSVLPSRGLIPPNGSKKIEVSLFISGEVTESAIINVVDSKQPNKPVSISVTAAITMASIDVVPVLLREVSSGNLLLSTSPPLWHNQKNEEASNSNNNSAIVQSPTKEGPVVLVELPTLTIEGCTFISKRRYEINLGQREMGSNPVVWEIVIKNLQSPIAITSFSNSITMNPLPTSRDSPSSSIGSLQYKVYPLDALKDYSWLSLNRNNGVLDFGEKHKITLTCSTKKMDSYATYLMIENLSNPGDLVVVHIKFKVVSRQITSFNVLVDEKSVNSQLTIDFGNVYYDQPYENRSFIILNESSLPMDFLVTSNLNVMDSTEVNFSLSRTSLNMFNLITVDAMSEQRVFIQFIPKTKLQLEEFEGQIEQKEIQICKCNCL